MLTDRKLQNQQAISPTGTQCTRSMHRISPVNLNIFLPSCANLRHSLKIGVFVRYPGVQSAATSRYDHSIFIKNRSAFEVDSASHPSSLGSGGGYLFRFQLEKDYVSSFSTLGPLEVNIRNNPTPTVNRISMQPLPFSQPGVRSTIEREISDILGLALLSHMPRFSGALAMAHGSIYALLQLNSHDPVVNISEDIFKLWIFRCF